MSFLDIKDPAEIATLVKEYVRAMKTVKQRNMMKREMKLAIGDELQTLFHPIVNATKQAAEETRKELEPMKKKLSDIDGALKASIDGALKPVAALQPGRNLDITFGIYRRKDGQLQMGSEIVEIDENERFLIVDGRKYDFPPGLWAFIRQKNPQVSQWPSRDYRTYKSLSAQTKVKSHPNPRGSSRPRATWKYKRMLKRMTVPGESIPEEESEDTDGTDTDSVGDISEPAILSPVIMSSGSGIMSPGPSPAQTRSHGKARKTKFRGAFYKGYKGEGVVYLPGDINGLARKLQLLAAEFFAGNTTVRNELVHVLDAWLRLEQLTRKEYTDIYARLAA